MTPPEVEASVPPPPSPAPPAAPVPSSLQDFCGSQQGRWSAELLSVFYEREQRAGRVRAPFDAFATRLVAFAEMPLE